MFLNHHIILTFIWFQVTGHGDVTYNSRRNILAAIPIENKISYHLWRIGSSGKEKNYGATLLRRSKWFKQYRNNDGNLSIVSVIFYRSCSHLDNYICGLDFDPAGEITATIDCNGVCIISSVNTGRYTYHWKLSDLGGNEFIGSATIPSYFCLLDAWDRCRWSTNTGESFLYVKHNGTTLNILDVERKTLTKQGGIELEQNGN